MVTCANDRRHSRLQIVITTFATVLIVALLTGCGQSAASHTSTPESVSTLAATSTSATSTSLQGPTNFILNNPLDFSQASGSGIANGAIIQLSSDTIEQNVTSTFQHTLFSVDSSNNIIVSTNSSSSPIQARTSTKADGSVNIAYTHSSGSGTITFNGTLTGNQMKATYTTSFISGTTVNGQTFSGGNTSTSTFTTQVRWVADGQIPSAPTNGHSQFTSDGGVVLTWSGNAAGYNVYRFVLTDSKGFQFIAKTTSTSYSDESQIAISNAKTITGISYTIYAVGPTGIENPNCVTLSLSSLD